MIRIYQRTTGKVLAEIDADALIEADLQGANLCAADVTLADLRRARFTGLRYDKRTRWPEGFDPARRGAIKVE